MDITHLGHSSFRIKGKSASVVTDPFGDIGIKFPKVNAEIVTVSHTGHGDHENIEGVAGVKKSIVGPGEYEILGISILGLGAYHDDKKGKERGKNTVYSMEIDGVRVVHLGDLGHKLSENDYRFLGQIDVLMVPVGGVYTIDAKVAAEVARTSGAKIVIPMHYKTIGLSSTFDKLLPVEDFVKEMSIEPEKTKKLTLNRAMIGEGTRLVVFPQ